MSPRRGERCIAMASACYAVLLRAYPASFRRRFGAQMREVFEDRCRAVWRTRGLLSLAPLLITAISEAATNGTLERIAHVRSRHILAPTAPRGRGLPGETVMQDLQYAFRTLHARPGFTALSVMTLALGIGANTAMFSIVNTTLLNPLPFAGGNRLVYIWRQNVEQGFMITPSRPMADAWRERAASLEGLTAFIGRRFVLTEGGEPESVDGMMVSPDFFSFLGVRPRLGRVFVSGDVNQRVVLLREGFWRQRFGGATDVIGRTMTLSDEPYEIVGVLPSRIDKVFQGNLKSVWLPSTDEAAEDGMLVLARIRSGVTPEAAEAELAQLYAGLPDLADDDGAWRPKIATPQAMLGNTLKTALWILLGSVGLVLLIACANVANMLMARGISRGHELAVRASLGATRIRIGRQLLTESLVVATMGGAIGAALAYVGLEATVTSLPDNLEDLRTARIEPIVLAFTAAVSLGTGVLFGLAPVLQVRSLSLLHVLNQASRTGTSGTSRSLLRNGLVGIEVALALVLSLGAGLLVNSLIRLQNVDPGFDASNILTMELEMSRTEYPDSATRHSFLAEVTEQTRKLPGVVAVATGSGVPPKMGMMLAKLVLEGEDPAAVQAGRPASAAWVSAEYFGTLRMRFIEGGGFTEADLIDASSPVVVNESFARTRWSRSNVVGERFKLDGGDAWFRVVGVSQDVAGAGLATTHDQTQLYFSSQTFGIGAELLIVRTAGDPLAMVHQLKQQVWSVDPHLPVRDIALVERLLSDSIARQRFSAFVLSGFAFLALALAAVGVYGVIALAVSQRTREIGVRVALGAQRRDITKLIVGYGMKPIAIGIVVGVGASVALSTTIRSLLFEIQPLDPLTYGIVVIVLPVVGFTAAYLPSRRAATIDPLDALREE